jgi:hypothetical protein
MIKQIEKLAILAIVLYVASVALQLIGKDYITELVNVQKWTPLQVFLLSIPRTAITLAVQIFIAIWLYIIASREKESPWIWALLGLVFGLLAPILFYVIKVYEKLNQGQKTS